MIKKHYVIEYICSKKNLIVAPSYAFSAGEKIVKKYSNYGSDIFDNNSNINKTNKKSRTQQCRYHRFLLGISRQSRGLFLQHSVGASTTKLVVNDQSEKGTMIFGYV